MKKLIMFMLAIFLLAMGSPVKALSPTGTGTETTVKANPDQETGYSTLQITFFRGKHYVYSKWDRRLSGSNLQIPLKDSLSYISPALPEKFWARIYWFKNFEFEIIYDIRMEFDKGWPLLERTTISHRGLLINQKMFYATVEKQGEKLPRCTFFLFIIFFALGLLVEGVKWVMEELEVSMYVWTLVWITLAFSVLLLLHWLALLFTAGASALGLAISYLIAKWLRQKKQSPRPK